MINHKKAKSVATLLFIIIFTVSNSFSIVSAENGEQTTLPSAYEAEYTPARNQGNANMCWAFSATAVMEANILKNSDMYTDEQLAQMIPGGVYDKTKPLKEQIDLFEKAMAYYCFNARVSDVTDPTYGDFSDENAEKAYEIGGHPYMAIPMLARWSGPASWDDTTPLNNEPLFYNYTSLWQNGGIPEVDRYASTAHLQRAVRISDSIVNRDEMIKQSVLEIGAVAIGYNAIGEGYNQTTDSQGNDITAFFSDDQTGNAGHAVTIVGWDDDFSVDNFKEGHKPKNNGAWLCKNSYGTQWGTNGLFWMSYEETTLGYATAFCLEPSDNYDNNYQYDGVCTDEGSSSYQTVGFNVFTAKDDEVLEAVSFYPTDDTYNPSDYTVHIYKNFTAFDNVTNNDFSDVTLPTADRTITGTTTDNYKTLRLENPLVLEKGEKYAVAVENKVSNQYTYKLDNCNNSQGQSFILRVDGKALDLYNNKNGIEEKSFNGYRAKVGGNLCIKAFTSDSTGYNWNDNGDGTHTGSHYYAVTEDHVFSDAVCIDEFVHEKTCTKCGAVIESEHSYNYSDNGDGTHKAVCECGFEIPSALHTYSCSDNNDGTHTKSCVCGNTVIEQHNYSDGVCQSCGAADNRVLYIDPTNDINVQYCSNYTEITSNISTLNSGWYVFGSDTTISDRISINGDVKIILEDGVTIFANGGIYVGSGNALSVYGQTAGTGKIIAKANGGGQAGIGGNEWDSGSSGNITVNGGTIEAYGTNGGAGIGSGHGGGSFSTITINGGTVTAEGGSCGGSGAGAGIGGGHLNFKGNIFITGGAVNAVGANSSGLSGAGIGGGDSIYNDGEANISISGGTVIATGGGNGAAAIGIGTSGNTNLKTITISGGIVKVKSNGFLSQNIEKNGGIIYEPDKNPMVYGTTVLSENITVGNDETIIIPSNSTLIIDDNATIINNGSIENAGVVINCGTVSGNDITNIDNGQIKHLVLKDNCIYSSLPSELTEARLIVASYTSDENMLECKQFEISKSGKVNISDTLINTNQAYQIKTFLWKDLNNLIPLDNTIKIPLQHN